MDCVTPCIAPVCNLLSNWASPKLKNIWYLKKNMEEFRSRKVELEAKGDDVNKHIESERRRGYQEKEEMRIWFENYEKIKENYFDLENQLPRYEKIGKWSRVRKKACKFCQEIAEMMVEINKHIDKAMNFELTSTELPPPNVEIENTEYTDGLRSIEKSKKAIYEALKDENVNVIGLWGMGGIGKTTLMQNINNEMAKGPDFNYVIMVTVSSNPDVTKIQDQIIRRLPNMKSTDSADIQRNASRANIISEHLKEMGRLGNVLIIFDDVWGALNFTQIGIPKSKLCKIVLTTRKQNVCKSLGAKEIKMDVLDPEDSWKLFESINVVDHKIKNAARHICEECAGLPLAISVVANSLKNETDVFAWRDSLNFLKNSNPQGVDELEKEVYNPLRLSYDRLKTDDLKDFFLLCSLFPEDHIIKLFDMICYGIGVGIPWATSKSGIESFDAFLNLFKQLKSTGLLQDFFTHEGCARMHDIVRDVAINIAKEKGFLIKTGLGFTDWPQFKEEENIKGMKWISLMENSLKDITYQPQNIQGVKFLSLNFNKELKSIHCDFFEEIQNLLLLDLRETSIYELTQCIQKLKELRVLIYDSGVKISIPVKELVTLKNLLVLCLQNSNIQELNEEFGTLVHLRVIDFSRTSIDFIRPKVFSRLQKLEVLFMHGSFCYWKASNEEDGDCVAFEELATLRHLYALRVDIKDEYIISDNYTLVECFPTVQHFSFRYNPDLGQMYSDGFNYNRLALTQNTQNIAEWLKILLEKTSRLEMCVHCRYSVDALIELDTIKDMHNLEVLTLSGGSNYKNVIKYSSNTESDERPILPNLKEISIFTINSLDTIIATPSYLPHGSFQGLFTISISSCNDMRFAFTCSMALCLVQLRWLNIGQCDELKHIILNDGYRNFDCLAIGREMFPKLESLSLSDLPKLESVWQHEENQENMQAQWPSMKFLNVLKCKNLKPFVFGKQSAPVLERIGGDREWFEDLIWEDEETKNKFKSLFLKPFIPRTFSISYRLLDY